MRFGIVGIAVALGLGCAVLGGGSAEESSPPHPMLVERGKQEYLDHCAVCHGVDATGNGPAASALRVAPADLTRIAERRGGEFPESDMAWIIDGRFESPAHGTREMPIWGVHLGEGWPRNEEGDAVVRGRIHTLVAYLKSIQRN